MSISIREELPEDIAAVRALNREAFGQDQEARIVDALREHGAVALSLVATDDGRVVGHVLYSPVTLDGRIEGAALGPMAVLPSCQRRGIGSRLIEVGNARLRREGCPFVVVLGHPHYYPRFGFEPANRYGMTCEWEVPDEVFMLLPLDRSRTGTLSGALRYRPEFSTIS